MRLVTPLNVIAGYVGRMLSAGHGAGQGVQG